MAVDDPARPGRSLVAREGEQPTMPPAVFDGSEGGSRRFGRDAIVADVAGREGRPMRSLKSILGSTPVDDATYLGDGITPRYVDVIASFLKRLKETAERERGGELR